MVLLASLLLRNHTFRHEMHLWIATSDEHYRNTNQPLQAKLSPLENEVHELLISICRQRGPHDTGSVFCAQVPCRVR